MGLPLQRHSPSAPRTGASARKAGSSHRSHRSAGPCTWPSASMTVSSPRPSRGYHISARAVAGPGYGAGMTVGQRYPILPIPWIPEHTEMIPAGVLTIGVGHRVLDEATAKAYLDEVGFVRERDGGG